MILLYIHPRYVIFATIMSVVASVILVIDLIIQVCGGLLETPGHNHRPTVARLVVDGIAIGVLIFAFILPPQALSSGVTGERTVKTSLSQEQRSKEEENQQCSTKEPDSLVVWVNDIKFYPLHCNENRTLEVTGFVQESNQSTLPDTMYYIGRVVIACCAIDAQPYVLPVQKIEGVSYEKDTWLNITGILKRMTINDEDHLVIVPSKVLKIESPTNPYEYITASSVPLITSTFQQ